MEIRQAAGLLLKNNMKTAFGSIAPSYQQYIKSELLPCLGATERHIRSTVGTVISVIVQQGRIFSWPELLQALLNCLESNDLNHMEGALDALSKVWSSHQLSYIPFILFHPRLVLNLICFSLLTHEKTCDLKISEDMPDELDSDVPGLVERPINIFMPRLLQVIWIHALSTHDLCLKILLVY